ADHFAAVTQFSVLNGRIQQFLFRLELPDHVIHPYYVAPPVGLPVPPPVHAINKWPTFYIHIHGAGKVEISAYIKPEITDCLCVSKCKLQSTCAIAIQVLLG